MFAAIKARLLTLQRRLAAIYGSDISTPEARRAAWWHFQLMDHAFLRVLWTNLHQVAPGVWRSNQPSPERLRHWHDKLGLRAVLNLRGESLQAFYLFEAETCRDLGMIQANLHFYAKWPPSRDKMLELISQFRTLPKPLLFHCKSGSDRTGLAAAIYLLVIENRPIAEARRQLSWRYLHIENSKAGVQDHILRLYARAHDRSGVGFEDWVRSDYDPDQIGASFRRWQAGDRALA